MYNSHMYNNPSPVADDVHYYLIEQLMSLKQKATQAPTRVRHAYYQCGVLSSPSAAIFTSHGLLSRGWFMDALLAAGRFDSTQTKHS